MAQYAMKKRTPLPSAVARQSATSSTVSVHARAILRDWSASSFTIFFPSIKFCGSPDPSLSQHWSGGPGLHGMGRLPAGSATGLCRRSGRHSNAHVTGEPAGCARPLRLLRALCKLVLHCVSSAPWGHALREGHVCDRK